MKKTQGMGMRRAVMAPRRVTAQGKVRLLMAWVVKRGKHAERGTRRKVEATRVEAQK